MFTTRAISLLVVLLGMSAALAPPTSAEQGHRGTIRGFESNTQQVTIDEGVFMLSKNVTIKNLAGGWPGTTALRKGTPIVFTVGPGETVTEIIILPESAQEQQELGYGPDTNQ